MFASIFVVIFGVELAVMLVLGELPPMPPLAVDIIAALALTFLGAPLLWFIVAKPLARGIISHVNAGVESPFGYAAREVVGQHVNLLLPERAHRPHEEHLAHFAAGPDHSHAIGHNALVDGRRKNGELFQVDVTLNPEPVAASSPTPRAA